MSPRTFRCLSVLLAVGLVTAAALAQPAPVSANNCPDLGELTECLKQASLSPFGMAAFALALLGAALARSRRDQPAQPTDAATPARPVLQRTPQADTQNTAYDPGDIEFG